MEKSLAADPVILDIPKFTLGTFRHKNESLLNDVVQAALQRGDIGFDTAPSYGTQFILGKALTRTGKSREGYFVSDKIDAWQMQQISLGHKNASDYIEEVLKENRLRYYDLLYIHWPIMEYMDDTVRQLKELMRQGKIRRIGISNVNIRTLNELRGMGFTPDVVQQEIHPLATEQELTQVCAERGIDLVAYTPTARLVYPIVENKPLQKMSKKYNKSITQVINRWHIQYGRRIAFMTTKALRVIENTDIFDFELTNDEMSAIDGINQDCNMFVHSTGAPGF